MVIQMILKTARILFMLYNLNKITPDRDSKIFKLSSQLPGVTDVRLEMEFRRCQVPNRRIQWKSLIVECKRSTVKSKI